MRNALALVALAAAMGLSAPGAGAAAPGEEAVLPLGRRLYRTGDDAAVRIVLPGGVERPARGFACTGCHGPAGTGGGEGGIRAPAITWAALSQPSDGGGTRPPRPGYDAAGLATALRVGLDPTGRPLGPAMPRYRADATVLAGLLAYLRVLGTAEDTDPGVRPDALLIGTALPLTGPRSQAGQAVRAVLERHFATLDAAGGVYGRRVALRVADSAAAPGGAAVRALIDAQEVFALLAPFDPDDGDAPDAAAAGEAMPVIGPITLAPWSPAAGPVFHLLPGLGDQARSLVDFAADTDWPGGGPARLAVLPAAGRAGADALAGAEAQARRRGLAIVARLAPDIPADDAAEAVRAAAADMVLCLAPPARLAEVALALDRAGSAALPAGSTQLLGTEIAGLPARILARLVLADPLAMPDPLRRAASDAPGRVEQEFAHAAAVVFTEALRQGGRDISRAGLEQALRRLAAVRIGALPPLGFVRGRTGTRAVAVIRMDPATGDAVTLAAARLPTDAGSRP